jgi:hypothetical protein
MTQMLSVGNTLGSSGATPSLDTRVAVGAGVFTVGPAETSAPEPEVRTASAPVQKAFAYNAYEFSYRSDFGKIILLQQNVETGQEVTQVPTEYHLRQYAASQREQRVQLQQKLYKGSGGETQGSEAPQADVVPTAAAKPASGPSAPAASPSPSPSAAPSTAAVATVAHVDIKA